MGSPAVSPYHVGVRDTTKNQRNGIVEIFVLRLLNQTFDCNAVGACRRGARPGRPEGSIREKSHGFLSFCFPGCHCNRLNLSYLWSIIESSNFKDALTMNVNLKNNSPHYLLIEFNSAEQEQHADDENLLAVSKRLIVKNRKAYEVLAK